MKNNDGIYNIAFFPHFLDSSLSLICIFNILYFHFSENWYKDDPEVQQQNKNKKQ